MPGSPEFPRALSEREAEILTLMLDMDDPRFQVLRNQASTASVIGRCPCGCATIDLQVDRSSGAAVSLPSPASGTWARSNPTVPDSFFELILFLDAGWLSSLEIVYYGQTVPTEFPPASDFQKPTLRPSS